MRERVSVARLVVASVIAMVAVKAGAMPLDGRVWEKAPEANAILESVRRNGEFSKEENERLRRLLRMDDRYMTAVVAYIVGESQGDDSELCSALEASRRDWSVPNAYITAALAKKELRGKSDEEKVEGFQAMLDDPDEFVRMCAAKEIARIDVEKGKEALKRVASTGVDDLAQGEAARSLYAMGGPDLGVVRISYMGCAQVFGMFAIIEGTSLGEFDRFWERIPARLLEILEEVRATGEISAEQTAYVIECVGQGTNATPEAKHVVSAVIYSKLKEPCPELLRALETSCQKNYGLPHALVAVAIVKDETRGRPDKEVVEALEPLTKHENPYLRVEAAKEIARLEPEKGKAVLMHLHTFAANWLLRGEAARVLDKMGEDTSYGAAHQHRWDGNYFYATVLKLIEDEPLW
ncbi:MAG: HEAT repeat domain-containing protein [bacterium]|nr:HEAT repeat domain-containing protein [bacterium]